MYCWPIYEPLPPPSHHDYYSCQRTLPLRLKLICRTGITGMLLGFLLLSRNDLSPKEKKKKLEQNPAGSLPLWNTHPATNHFSLFPSPQLYRCQGVKNARKWKNGFARKWESMIMIEQQRLIESNLKPTGLIKGQRRRLIDSAPKDLCNWTRRLVMIKILWPLIVSLYGNKLKEEQCEDTLQKVSWLLRYLEFGGTFE